MKEWDLSKYSEFCLQAPFDFAAHSSIGCGGSAKVAFYPQSVEEVASLWNRLTEEGRSFYVLGNLTNVLPSDKDSDCAVISIKKLNGVVLGENIFTYAGTTSGGLLNVCKRENRSGAEFLSGIPCTMGGALYMNAGAGGKYISEIVESVLVLRKGERKLLPLAECGYAYKKSVFMENGDIILGATLRLEDASAAEIALRESYYIDRRKHLPKGRSMGCVFKNPEGGFAGDLIERSGLKGFRLGGVKISEEHANFIINDRGGNAAEIRALITLTKNAVKSQYGVCLEEEIRYIGE